MFSQQGFTLVELLLVVLIIAILAAIALPQYQLAVAKTKAMQAIIIVDSVWRAQEIYYLTNGKLAADYKDFDVSLPEFSQANKGIVTYEWGECRNQPTNANGPRILCTMMDGALTIYRLFRDNTQNDSSRYCQANLKEGKGQLAKKVCLSLGNGESAGGNANQRTYKI